MPMPLKELKKKCLSYENQLRPRKEKAVLLLIELTQCKVNRNVISLKACGSCGMPERSLSFRDSSFLSLWYLQIWLVFLFVLGILNSWVAHNGPSLQCMTAFSNLQPVANPGWSPLSLCPSYSPSTGNRWNALYSLIKWHSLGVVLYAEQTNLTLSDCRSVLTDLWMDESPFFSF